MTLNQYIRDIQDFPKPGIVFKDITPLLANPVAVNQCMALLMNNLKERKIDKVVGVESRGFFFATLLAYELGAGFVPIRKPKKLPFETISSSYKLEYGMDTLEVHTDAIKRGERVLVHDDVLATGVLQKQCANLWKGWVEKLCSVISSWNFLFLKAERK